MPHHGGSSKNSSNAGPSSTHGDDVLEELDDFYGQPIQRDWKSITDRQLHAAVDSLRALFRNKAAAVRYESAAQANEAIYASPLAHLFREAGHDMQSQAPSDIFQSKLDEWREALIKIMGHFFQKLLNIAIANRNRLSHEPVSWTYTHIRTLIAEDLGGSDGSKTLDGRNERSWIRWACDGLRIENQLTQRETELLASGPTAIAEQRQRQAKQVGVNCESGLEKGASEAWETLAKETITVPLSPEISGPEWYAPAWLRTQLSRAFGSIALPDPLERLDRADTDLILAKITKRFVEKVEFALTDIARKARVELAAQRTVAPAYATVSGSVVPVTGKERACSKSTAQQSVVQDQGGRSRTATARIRIAENPIDQRKQAFIFAAIKDGKRGRAYCDFLGQNSIPVPLIWVKNKCPRNYPDAYSSQDEHWRRLIVQEKNRYSRKLHHLERDSPGEADKIIGRYVRPLAPSGAG